MSDLAQEFTARLVVEFSADAGAAAFVEYLERVREAVRSRWLTVQQAQEIIAAYRLPDSKKTA